MMFLTPGRGFRRPLHRVRVDLRAQLKSTGSPPATGPTCARRASAELVRVAPYGKSEAQSDVYAPFDAAHLINGLSGSQRLTQERVGMILNGGAHQVQASDRS